MSKASAEKQNTKVLQSRKYRRRQYLAFVRMVRYGVNNFSRNIWLTVAATAVMSITLLVIFLTVAAQNIITDTVKLVSQDVDMSIYLKKETTADDIAPALRDLDQLSNVESTSFISSEESRAADAEAKKDDPKYLAAISEADSQYPAIIRIKLDDINDTSQLSEFVETNENVQPYLHDDREPSFAGDKRDAIQTIANWTVIAQQIGITISIVFVVISSLIVFNTIRMAIFSRKDEIEMMKLIGANQGFIRGPFVVEAIVYGFIAAVLATGAGILLLDVAGGYLSGAGFDITSTTDLAMTYIGFIVLAMIIIGAVIGTVSALLAMRKYLKI